MRGVKQLVFSGSASAGAEDFGTAVILITAARAIFRFDDNLGLASDRSRTGTQMLASLEGASVDDPGLHGS